MTELPSTDASITSRRIEVPAQVESSVELREMRENQIESSRRRSAFSYRLTAVRNSGRMDGESLEQQQTSSRSHAPRKAPK